MKNRMLITMLALALFVSCEKAAIVEQVDVVEPLASEASHALPGQIRVKLDKEPAPGTKADASFDLSSLGSYRMVRTFPYAGKFEKRHREAGLHLWYDIIFDDSIPATKATEALKDNPSVVEVEYILPIAKTATEYPFNDPMLPYQWHYTYAGGTNSKYLPNSNINLFKAWELQTGSPEVIVGVVDMGVQYDHPDLAQNMWVNEAELNGKEGVDDDNNGYVDDIYGYNFVADGDKMIGTINPGDHGTHIAGTIAAVNNNGIGMCGIAGGNGSSGSGVRIMSVQTSDGPAYTGPAIAYAADMGAIVINCSWEFPDANSTPASVAEAIRYFNKYAGLDENGKQIRPMAGGVAVFAAGNSSKEKAYPAMDDNVVAVSAIGGDYVRSYYSNYGTWVDISAPGGDAEKGTFIYSTVPTNDYGTMQGTSMAAPHVTGVCALIASQHGGEGFDREKMINILLNTANKKIYNYNNKMYNGKLGVGLVDAYAAVSVRSAKPTVTPVDGTMLELKSHQTGVLRFNVSDEYGHDLSYSIAPLEKGGELPGLESSMAGGVITIKVNALKASEGKTYKGVLSVSNDFDVVNAEFTYKVAVNHAPEIVSMIGDLVFNSTSESVELDLSSYFRDADGENLRYDLVSSSNAVNGTIEGNKLVLSAAKYGVAALSLEASDARGESKQLQFQVLVRDGSYAADLYPNPVVDNLFVRLPERRQVDIVVTNKLGASVFSTAASVGPFSPASISMRGYQPGTYYVSIKGEGIDYKTTIVKL